MTSKYTTFTIAFILSISLSIFPESVFSSRGIENFSFNFQNGSLRDFTLSFQKETGYKFIFNDESYYDLKIKGLYKNISYSTFISHIFKGFSYITLIDENNRTIFVSIYEKSTEKKDLSLTQNLDTASFNSEINSEMPDDSLVREQEEVAFFNDPDSIDPLSELSNNELRERVLMSEQEFKQLRFSPNLAVPFSGSPDSP